MTPPVVTTEEQFEDWVRSGASVVPVYCELLSDGWTPVQAYSAFQDQPGSFLLESVVGGERWARYSFVGLGPKWMLTGSRDGVEVVEGAQRRVVNGEPWTVLRGLLSKWKPPTFGHDLPPFWGGAVGYVPYDAVKGFEPTIGDKHPDPTAPTFMFGLGSPTLIFDNIRQTLRVVVPCFVDGDAKDAYVFASRTLTRVCRELAERRSTLAPMAIAAKQSNAALPASSFSRPAFVEAVEKAKEHIRAGDIFQVVLSQRFEIDAPDARPFDVYRHLRVMNPSPYMFFLALPGKNILGASPETLVRLEDGHVHVRPIAGTRRRGDNAETDRAAEADLLADPKEIAEHVMLVDLGRNDVGRISDAGTVVVTEKMTVERYSHVMHLVSNVRGKLAAGMDALDVLRATFPAGTLSGAPKVRAMQIIDALEPVRRDVYGGAVGYIGFGLESLDVAIAIRTIVEERGRYRVQAGAGIVEASKPENEYDETVDKARAALMAIIAARG